MVTTQEAGTSAGSKELACSNTYIAATLLNGFASLLLKLHAGIEI